MDHYDGTAGRPCGAVARKKRRMTTMSEVIVVDCMLTRTVPA
jgi:hypothetical protein